MEITINQLKGFGDLLNYLGEERSGRWWNSHARRYRYFSSRGPYYHNCAYAKKTKKLFEQLEQEEFIQWLGENEDLVSEWERNKR